jgi:DNA-binding transcriptional ArsR family regulator
LIVLFIIYDIYIYHKGEIQMRANITVSDTKNIINPNSMSFEERQKDLEQQAQMQKIINKKMKDSPFSNFYQFNREYSKEMIWLATNHPKANGILLFLLDQMDSYNAVMCSYKVLQEALGMGQATVARSIKILKDTGFISVYKSGTSNIYAVNKQLAWSSWGTNHKYAKFEARIIISESEQEKSEPKLQSIKHKEIQIKKVQE